VNRILAAVVLAAALAGCSGSTSLEDDQDAVDRILAERCLVIDPGPAQPDQ